jgi:predicted transglutaminase-like cysteine proteinase
MFDAIEHLKLGDLQRAVVDMAVSCESYLRLLIANNLPVDLLNSIKEYIDDVNIRPVLMKFVPEIFNEEERKRLQKIEGALNKLFDTRNDILHAGRAEHLTMPDCEKYLKATRELIRLRV